MSARPQCISLRGIDSPYSNSEVTGLEAGMPVYSSPGTTHLRTHLYLLRPGGEPPCGTRSQSECRPRLDCLNSPWRSARARVRAGLPAAEAGPWRPRAVCCLDCLGVRSASLAPSEIRAILLSAILPDLWTRLDNLPRMQTAHDAPFLKAVTSQVFSSLLCRHLWLQGCLWPGLLPLLLRVLTTDITLSRT